MPWEKTKCPFCGKEAEELWYWVNLRLRCFECNIFYSLTTRVQVYRFDKNKNQFFYRDPLIREKIPLTDKKNRIY